MRIHSDLIPPEEIKQEYNTAEFTDKDGSVYMEVTGAIYRVSQSGYLAGIIQLKEHQDYGNMKQGEVHSH